MRMRATFAVLFAVAALAGVASFARAQSPAAPQAAATPLYDPQALPAGPVGDAIRYGHDIVVNTSALMKPNVRARLNCSDCHVNAGTKPRGGSFIGTYAYFPQWNVRANRVIELQDRLAECFLYSMNGRPPAYSSKEMVALVAYIAWLSRGKSEWSTPPPNDRFIVPLPSASPNVAHGAALYAQTCQACHQADGSGVAGAFPPLWGPTSFNNGAGMAHLNRMTGFVMYNMPQNAPGSLSLQDAYDVSGFVLSHQRPAFDPAMLVQPSPTPASYF